MNEEQLYKGKYKGISLRKPGWKYHWKASYFVTICTRHKLQWFGECQNGCMCLSDIGSAVAEYLQEIPVHFSHVSLDGWIVMPDHVHFIIDIGYYPLKVVHINSSQVGTSDSDVPTGRNKKSPQRPLPGSLGSIINQFKSVCTKKIRRSYEMDFMWQSRYHDRIIRNEEQRQRYRKYILENPQNWKALD